MEENYIVSARKYRPATFSSVVGQPALTATLRTAIQTNRLAHAYLFCGSRGVGKTTCARIFAKTINCANPTPDGDPCNECPSCRAFNENRSLNITELDAASNNSVDDIRALIDNVQILPVDAKYRVVIVDEVHMLSPQAFNAFLKTLEEPPSHVIFILATTEKHKIIPTILSRCQIFDFKRITITDIIDHLEYVAKSEGITAQREALGVIARQADGAMRDALSIFDQIAASSRGNITYKSTIDNLNILDEAYFIRLLECFISGNVPQALLIYKETRDMGFDSQFFLNGVAGFIRNLMVARDPATLPLLDTDEQTRQRMVQLASQLPPQFYYAAMSLCNDADMEYRTASSKSFLVELLLIKLCQLHSPSPTSNAGNGEGQKIKPIAPANIPAQAPAAPAAAAPTAAPQPAVAPQGYSPAPAQAQPQVPVSTPAPAPTAPAPAPRPAATSPAATAVPAAPAPRPVTPARHSSTLPKGKSHISLRGETPSQTAGNHAAAGAAPTAPVRSARFTNAQLRNAWEKYMEINKKAHVLCNTMRAAIPTRPDEETTRLTVTVLNQPQVDLMTQELPALLKFLHDTLANDLLTIDIHINDDPDAPAAWNERRLLQHIVDSNPNIAALISDFDLTLS